MSVSVVSAVPFSMATISLGSRAWLASGSEIGDARLDVFTYQ